MHVLRWIFSKKNEKIYITQYVRNTSKLIILN